MWWKSHLPVNGFITRHLSPFESKVMEPLAKNWQKKTWARVCPSFLFDVFDFHYSLAFGSGSAFLCRFVAG
jgi:hypothetical protein